MTDADRWLSVKDAAPAAGVSESTVRRYIRDGAVKPIMGRVRLSQVLTAERDARQRMQAGLKAGGARGPSRLRKLADEFFARGQLDDAGRGQILAFVEFAGG